MTYVRRNVDLQKRELMGYGAESGTMNIEYFKVLSPPPHVTTAFGKKILRLESVCWMNPRATIENIPSHWKQISVAIYHQYYDNCRLQDTHVDLHAQTMAQAHEEGKDSYVKLDRWSFNKQEIAMHPKNQGIREHLVTLDVPAEICADGPYMLKLVVNAASGSWKSNWGFEGFGIV